ncbi:MAG TPA: hypothetical protein VNS58_10245 [Puia sp.]|nr:hypothetical protein [Puia sp.]
MRLKLIYTLILIFCMSAFASSNECSRVSRNGHPRIGPAKGIPADKPLVSEEGQPYKEELEYSPLQVIKFLYI